MAFGFLKKLTHQVASTTKKMVAFPRSLFFSGKISADSLEALESALYTADFGLATSQKVISKVKEAFQKNRDLRSQEIIELAQSVLQQQLRDADQPLALSHSPHVIVLLGVNGSGKTTTAAKLAYYFQQQGKSVLLGACDTFRAAANEQIDIWSQRLGIELVRSHHGADAAAVAFDCLTAAIARKIDIVILDTAGRLHNKIELMDELAKLKRVIQKKIPDAPHDAILVVDGSLGSNSIQQARFFHEKFGLTGLIITKLDGTSRGGALVGIHQELQLPIYFIGLGEKPEDLIPFSIENYISGLFESD